MQNALDILAAQISRQPSWRDMGQVTQVAAGKIHARGLDRTARLGDQAVIRRRTAPGLRAEVIQLSDQGIVLLPYGAPTDVRLGDPVEMEPGGITLAPSDAWVGRVIDPFGDPLDGRPLFAGAEPRALLAPPPPAHARGLLGRRLGTGVAALNTFLPLVEGQRLGLFAGAGVGKSHLIAQLCQQVDADIVVVALIGERGRELRQFLSETLGTAGLARSVIVAATSDQSALLRRRCAWSAMTVAEHFRDQGKRVLLLADSVTRFAEAHREVALAQGELPAMRGFPPSTAQMIMSLCERAGPGLHGVGSITAVFSVLVAGSDFDEPVADILRGVLDGHVVLDRSIAERGRFPAIDVLRSVSRSLPGAATTEENAILSDLRALLGAYERSEAMIKAGLYVEGHDPVVDRAVRIWNDLDTFFRRSDDATPEESFDRLRVIQRRAGPGG